MPKFISILSRDAAKYAELFTESTIVEHHDVQLDIVSTDPKALFHSRTQILLTDPGLGGEVIDTLAHLQWCQSTWAGNSPLIQTGRNDYFLTGAKGIFSHAMTEYVLTYILHHCRHVNKMQALQQQKTWQPPIMQLLSDKTLGIMGFGNIAHGMVEPLQALGLKLVALNSDGRNIFGYPKIPVEASVDKCIFAQQADIILNLLPDSTRTNGFIDKEFIHSMQPDTLFINAGRGSVIDDNDLLYALKLGKIGKAVLDVTMEEPLPKEHPFWEHPQILLTQHTAATSKPEWVFEIFEQNLQRFFLRAPLKYQVNWEKGY